MFLYLKFQTALSRQPELDTCSHDRFLTMTDTIASQNINFSYSVTLCI